MNTVTTEIYENEGYWRDGANHNGHGEWEPYSKIYSFFEQLFGFSRILDAGCGCGPFIRYGSIGTTFGIDFSRYAVGHPIPGAEGMIAYGKLSSIPFRDDFFDVVTAFNMMEHVSPDLARTCLEELFRVSSEWVVLMICLASDYDPYLEYEYCPGEDISLYDHRTQGEIKRGHWCVHSREWWIDKVGKLGTIDLEKEKQILDFTSRIVGESDKHWTARSKGLLVFRKAVR